LEIRGSERRSYRLEASLRTLQEPFVPCRVEVGGRELAPRRWSFDRDADVLRTSFAGRRVALEVTGRECA
jgi:hypothetical protein